LAGLGRKVFNSGDILLASEVQGYLQDQSVMVFDDSATRATAIGTANFSEGMVTYTKDDDAIQVYDGATFVAVGGDSGLVHINTTSFSAVASQSINDVFSADYDNYMIIIDGTCTAITTYSFRYRVGGADDSTSNYDTQRENVAGTGQTSARTLAGNIHLITTATKNSFYSNMLISFPFLSKNTRFISEGGTDTIDNAQGQFTTTTSFTGFSFIATSGNMTGSISIWGIKQ
jgi:hypothetical protein